MARYDLDTFIVIMAPAEIYDSLFTLLDRFGGIATRKLEINEFRKKMDNLGNLGCYKGERHYLGTVKTSTFECLFAFQV